ncbi:MAG: putative collagen-binding domain-containing protein [Blastocatellia bacterium]
MQCARAADGSSWLIYITDGRTIRIDVGKVSGANVRAWWYSPRDGRTYAAEGKPANRPFQTLKTRDVVAFDPPGEPGENNDWVLVLDDERKLYPAPGAAFSQAAARLPRAGTNRDWPALSNEQAEQREVCSTCSKEPKR